MCIFGASLWGNWYAAAWGRWIMAVGSMLMRLLVGKAIAPVTPVLVGDAGVLALVFAVVGFGTQPAGDP